MGCVSSTLLNQDADIPQIGGFSHHIVSLTSTTYGFLTLDNPLPSAPPAITTATATAQPLETINSWDLMSGLDTDDHIPSFRYLSSIPNDENANPNLRESSSFLDKLEKICPPKGDKRVVLYITSLRGVRKTFEDCEAVRSAIRGLGIPACERDISMDRGYRDELRELMKGKDSNHLIPPRLFVNGRYVGGVEEVMKIVDRAGSIAGLLQGIPKTGRVELRACEGCGGVGFLPCSTCHGSCKTVMEDGFGFGFGIGVKQRRSKRALVLRCSECNENGLVICPICC